MTTGTLYQGTCYIAASDANDAYYQSIPPFISNNGTSTNIQYFLRSNNGAWSFVTRNYTASSSTQTSSVGAYGQIFPTCDTSNYPLQDFFNQSTFELIFTGVLLLWAIGLGSGFIVAQVRRLRMPSR